MNCIVIIKLNFKYIFAGSFKVKSEFEICPWMMKASFHLSTVTQKKKRANKVIKNFVVYFVGCLSSLSSATSSFYLVVLTGEYILMTTINL